MSLSVAQVAILSFAWLAYFAAHSILASLRVKAQLIRRWPALGSYYRLFFNGIALVSLLPILYLLVIWRSEPLWQWLGGWLWLAHGLTLTALAGFIWTLKYYDGGEFMGLNQLRKSSDSIPQEACFVLSPMHRYVRHPWYFLALILIWTREMDAAFLLSAVLMTGYFVLGALLEERKLVEQLGSQYEQYQRQVPALLPLPWRILSREEAKQMSATARSGSMVEKKPKK